MSTQIQYRRGTSAENDSFTGALGEVTVDTTLNSLRVHNGTTAGGSKIISVNSQTGHANITGNLLPTANVTYDLGSITNRWRTAYFSANTIDLGGSQISVSPTTGFSFTVGGTTPITMSGNGAITSNTLLAPTTTVTATTATTSVSTGAFVVNGGVGIAGNLYVGGNLNIAGNLVTYNANNLTVDDSIIYLAANNSADLVDIGFVGHFINPGYQHTGLVRDATDGVWKLFANVTAEPTTTIDFTNANYNTLLLGNLIATGNLIAANITAGGSLGTAGQFLSQTGSGLGWVTLSSSRINTNASNVTVDTSYVNVAVNGSNVFSFGATQMITTQSIIPSANASISLGSLTNQWSTIYGKATTAQYADLAENYMPDSEYAPGTVLVFGGSAEVMQSHSSHDTRIAGVVSTDPAYLMNSTLTGVPVALQGRVPCRVLGPVEQGDRVVSSHIPGVAQRLDPAQYQPGCIIGKALQAIDSTDIETIEVVVGRV